MYTFTKPNLITEQFILPSGGKIYNLPWFDGHITLRAMTTIEERIRLGSQNFYEGMVSIVNECIVDNKNPDGTYKLDSLYFTLFDFDAICVKLRIITYGPEYKVNCNCIKCGKQFTYKADLRDCEFSFLPEDFIEPYDVGPLPHSGDTLGCRFLRVKDKIDIDKKAQEILVKNPDYIGDPEYLLDMTHRIMTINGEDSDVIMTSKYVENMIGLDSDYFHRFIDSAFYGVRRLGFTDCPDNKCGSKVMYIVKADENFFRAGRDY